MDASEHWQQVYATRAPDAVSWYQVEPVTSLALIERAGVARDAPILDVGGGASRLVDRLLQRGHTDVSVLDLSAAALDHARRRLGDAAARVHWQVGDVTRFEPPRTYALWHDRAVLHFLVDADDRAAYVATLSRALAPGGQAVIATFAPDGPRRCSGLPVRRYDAGLLTATLGASFELLETLAETHLTPGGAEQHFRWFRVARPS